MAVLDVFCRCSHPGSASANDANESQAPGLQTSCTRSMQEDSVSWKLYARVKLDLTYKHFVSESGATDLMSMSTQHGIQAALSGKNSLSHTSH